MVIDGSNDRRVGVVYVIASMITGGTQTHLLQVFRFLNRDRFRPYLLCLRDQGNLLEAARDTGVDVHTFGMTGTLRSPRDVTGLLRMVRFLRRRKVDIVHGYLLRGNFYGAVAATVGRVPVVITSKRGLHVPVGIFERGAVAVSNRLSTVITGNSPAVIDFTRKTENPGRGALEMIPSGIDPERFRPRREQSLREELGLVGRPVLGTAITFRPRKGYAMLFRVFARLRERVPELVLAIAGVEHHSEASAALAKRLGIGDAVVLLGKRSDMPAVHNCFDVFVLPSESEGMSNAVLEAMSSGVPIVATRTGGNALVTGDGAAGYIVDYEDDLAMAERIEALFADDELRAKLGAEGRRRVLASYSSRAMVASMESLYQRLIGRTPAAAREAES